jgi:hypothetical protein
MTQDEALALLESGASVFLTGEPGSGKTHTVSRYLRALKQAGIDYAYTASTGIAATQGHGVTIHAWSGIGVRDALSPRDLDAIASNRRIANRVAKTRVLVIDEISMLPARSLALVDAVCRHIKDPAAPFGGMQIVLAGDFFQLPPVERRDTGYDVLPLDDGADSFGSRFAYASSAWRDLAPQVCYLSEQHRQSDRPFLEVLASIRANECDGELRERLAARLIARDRLPEKGTLLFTHNAAVDDINKRELSKLKGESLAFSMTAKGPDPMVQALQRFCLSPATLVLKREAIVMFTRNDTAGRYVNGTLGVIESFDSEDGFPVVRTRNGARIVAEPATWKIEEAGRERASVTQVPLRLAWAMTVHKSQGMSLDAAVIDLSRAFEYGQGYVALSRLRSLSGLYLLGLNERALRVHPEAVETDAAFRAASEAARTAILRDAAVLAERQRAFLGEASASSAAEGAAPRQSRGSGYPKAYEVAALRQTHAKAYAPWTETEEQDLRQRYASGEKIDAIAASLGRKPGAIRSRLKKLALI